MPFSGCMGADDRAAFERGLLENFDVVLQALAKIDIAEAQAGKEADRALHKSEKAFRRIDEDCDGAVDEGEGGK